MNELNQKVVDEIIKIQKLVKNVLTFEINNSFVTSTQFQALIYIKSKKNIQMKDVAAYFSVTMPTATTLIEKLIKSKLVDKRNDLKDRRIVKLNLTKFGEKLLNEALRQKRFKTEKLLANYSPDEKIQLRFLLKKMHSN